MSFGELLERRMAMRTARLLPGVLIVLAIACAAQPAPASDGVPRITKEEAKALLGKPNVVFVDARTDSAWKGSDRKITGAVRYDRFDPDAVAGNSGKDTTFIVY
jgi:hypothetical protein